MLICKMAPSLKGCLIGEEIGKQPCCLFPEHLCLTELLDKEPKVCWIGAVDPYTCIERAGYDGCFPYAMYLPKSCLERFHAHALLHAP